MAKKWYLPDGTVTEVYQPGAVSSISDLTNPTARTTAQQLEASLLPKTQPKPTVPQPGVTTGIPKPTFAPEVGGSFRNLLLRLYPEKIQKGLSQGYTGFDVENFIIEDIQNELNADPIAWLTTLSGKRLPNETKALLDYMGLSNEKLEDGRTIEQAVVGQQQSEVQLIQTINQIPELRGYNLESLTQLIGTNPEVFVSLIRQGGVTTADRDLLRALGVDEATITEIIRTPFAVGKDIDRGALAIQAENREREKRVAEGKQGKYGRVFTAGVGDLVANIGGVFKWAGAEGIGDKISQAGQFMQVQAMPVEKGEFKWQELFNPSSYSFQSTLSSLIRTTPTLMTLMIPGIGAYGLAGGVATKLGLNAFGRAVITGIGGTAISRPMEGAMEAAQSYDEARGRGLSHEEATKVANSVFKKNLAFAGTDIIQLTTAFLPTPFKASGSLIKRGLVTTAQVGGKLAITGLTEGGEEIFQDLIQRQARGEKFKMDADAQQVFAIGALMGGLLGGAGDVMVRITDKVSSKLPPSQKADFDAKVAEGVRQGLDEQRARTEAMNGVIEENPAVAKQVEEASQDVNQEITQEAVAETTEQRLDRPEEEELARVREQMAGKVPTPEVPKAVPDKFAIDDVIRYQEKRVSQETNPLNLTFEKQALADLKKAKAQGRTEVPAEYFKVRGKIEIPDELVKAAPKAVPEVALPPGGRVVSPPVTPGVSEANTELQRIIGKWSGAKARNAQRAESDLAMLEKQGFEITDAKDALQEYKDTVRADFDIAEDFSEARTDAWENFIQELDSIEKPVTPAAPAVEITAEMIPVGEIPTLETWDKMPIPEKVKIVERLGLSGRLGSASFTEFIVAVKTQMAEVPVTLEKETEDISDLIKIRGDPLYTIEQIDALSGIMGDYLVNPNIINAYQVVRQYQALERARRFKNVSSRRKDLIVTEGLSWEEAHNKAMDEFARGKLPSLTVEGLEDITAELRDVFFAKVHHTFDQLGSRYEGERWATITALTNALAGTPIPMEKGKGSILFPKGGSAWDRLNYVFSKQPGLMEGITKTAEQKKSLEDVTQGIFREVPEGGFPPIPIDQEMAEYLRSLANKPRDQIRLAEQEGLLTFREAEDLTNKISDLKIVDQRTVAEKIIEMRRKGLLPAPPVTKFDAPIEKAFKQPPLNGWPIAERKMLVKVLKEIAWAPVDIGNFLRAMKATLDNSFLRQGKVLAAGHPLVAYKAHNTAWRAMFNQSVAEASWERITRRPWFPIYEQIRIETGHDPLRVPAFATTKGTAQYRTAEEFGFPTVERLIPRLTAKLPIIKPFERAFSAGTNEIVAGIMDIKYAETLRGTEKIASGEVKLKVGESFDIVQEMTAFQDFLGNLIQRGTLPQQARGLAPVFNAFFFALRSKLGRFLAPTHLLGLTRTAKGVKFNPRVMREAWKDFTLFNAEIGGIMFLGSWLGLWDLEDDPGNAEFMSARIGNTRIDPWAGYRQFVVLYARLITKTGISSVTGAEYEVNPTTAVGNFIRNSLSPFASTMLEFWTGRNFLGQVIDYEDKKYWLEKIAAFSLWDIWEAFEDGGWGRASQVVIPAIYGEGVQTYTGDWEDNWKKLGIRKFLEVDGVYYDTADWWADTAPQFKGVEPATLTPKKGFEPQVKALAEALVINTHLSTLPSERLASLNADPSKGITFGEIRDLWSQRQALVDAGDDAEFVENELQPDGTYKKVTYKGDKAVTVFDKHEFTFRGVTTKGSQANNGNFSQRQFALLNDYWLITDKEKQAEFLEEHKAEIGIKPRDEYLKSHPKENALLAAFGQADIRTPEAYTEFKRLVKELDIPENALPERTLPPDGSLDTHWKYEQMVTDGKHGSWEAQLMLINDAEVAEKAGKQSYADWKALKLSDTSKAVLELQVKNADALRLNDSFSDPDSPNYKKDKDKDADGKTERDRAREQLYKDNPGLKDDESRIEALKFSTKEMPTPDAIINAHVEYKRIKGEEPEDEDTKAPTLSGIKGFLFRVDDPDYEQWRMDNKLNKNTVKDNPRIPIWRIDVKYQKEDAEYTSGIPDKYSKMTHAQINAIPPPEGWTAQGWAIRATQDKKSTLIALDRKAYYDKNKEYAIANITRKGYELGLTDGTIMNKWIAHNQMPLAGPDRDLDLVDNPDLVEAVNKAKLADGDKPWELPSTRQINILRIDKQWAKEDAAYKAILDNYVGSGSSAEKAATKAFLDLPENAEYRIARYRRNAYELDLDDTMVETWVGYEQLPETGYWRERYRRDTLGFEETVNAAKMAKGLDPWDELPKNIPSEGYDILTETYQDWFDRYEAARSDGERDAIFVENPTFKRAYYQRQGYKLMFPDDLTDEYADYNLLTLKGWARERYFQTHPELYREYRRIKFIKEIDFSKVPTERIEALWNDYSTSQDGQHKIRLRRENPDFEDWLVLTGKVNARTQSQVDRQFEELMERIKALSR